MAKPPRCSEKDCNRPAYVRPLLKLPLLNDGSGDYYQCIMDLPICSLHRKTMTFDKIVTVDAWELICNEFMKSGLEIPDRLRSSFKMVRI